MEILKTANYKKLSKKKDWDPNPWAVCTDSVGREDPEKYERCVKKVKKKQNKKAQILNIEGLRKQINEQYVRQLAEIGNSLGESVIKREISKEEALQQLEQQAKILAEKILTEKIKSLSMIEQEGREDIDSFKQLHPDSQITQ